MSQLGWNILASYGSEDEGCGFGGWALEEYFDIGEAHVCYDDYMPEEGPDLRRIAGKKVSAADKPPPTVGKPVPDESAAALKAQAEQEAAERSNALGMNPEDLERLKAHLAGKEKVKKAGSGGKPEEGKPVSVEQRQLDMLLSMTTPSGWESSNFRPPSTLESGNLATGKMLRETGMPPELFAGGAEALVAYDRFAEAKEYVHELKLGGKKFLSLEDIIKIHGLVEGESSGFRDVDVKVKLPDKGSGKKRDWDFPAHDRVAALMDHALSWQKDAVEMGGDPKVLGDRLRDLVVRIHPFEDGNGRTAELIEEFYLVFPGDEEKSGELTRERGGEKYARQLAEELATRGGTREEFMAALVEKAEKDPSLRGHIKQYTDKFMPVQVEPLGEATRTVEIKGWDNYSQKPIVWKETVDADDLPAMLELKAKVEADAQRFGAEYRQMYKAYARLCELTLGYVPPELGDIAAGLTEEKLHYNPHAETQRSQDARWTLSDHFHLNYGEGGGGAYNTADARLEDAWGRYKARIGRSGDEYNMTPPLPEPEAKKELDDERARILRWLNGDLRMAMERYVQVMRSIQTDFHDPLKDPAELVEILELGPEVLAGAAEALNRERGIEKPVGVKPVSAEMIKRLHLTPEEADRLARSQAEETARIHAVQMALDEARGQVKSPKKSDEIKVPDEVFKLDAEGRLQRTIPYAGVVGQLDAQAANLFDGPYPDAETGKILGKAGLSHRTVKALLNKAGKVVMWGGKQDLLMETLKEVRAGVQQNLYGQISGVREVNEEMRAEFARVSHENKVQEAMRYPSLYRSSRPEIWREAQERLARERVETPPVAQPAEAPKIEEVKTPQVPEQKPDMGQIRSGGDTKYGLTAEQVGKLDMQHREGLVPRMFIGQGGQPDWRWISNTGLNDYKQWRAQQVREARVARGELPERVQVNVGGDVLTATTPEMLEEYQNLAKVLEQTGKVTVEGGFPGQHALWEKARAALETPVGQVVAGAVGAAEVAVEAGKIVGQKLEERAVAARVREAQREERARVEAARAAAARRLREAVGAAERAGDFLGGSGVWRLPKEEKDRLGELLEAARESGDAGRLLAAAGEIGRARAVVEARERAEGMLKQARKDALSDINLPRFLDFTPEERDMARGEIENATTPEGVARIRAGLEARLERIEVQKAAQKAARAQAEVKEKARLEAARVESAKTKLRQGGGIVSRLAQKLFGFDKGEQAGPLQEAAPLISEGFFGPEEIPVSAPVVKTEKLAEADKQAEEKPAVAAEFKIEPLVVEPKIEEVPVVREVKTEVRQKEKEREADLMAQAEAYGADYGPENISNSELGGGQAVPEQLAPSSVYVHPAIEAHVAELAATVAALPGPAGEGGTGGEVWTAPAGAAMNDLYTTDHMAASLQTLAGSYGEPVSPGVYVVHGEAMGPATVVTVHAAPESQEQAVVDTGMPGSTGEAEPETAATPLLGDGTESGPVYLVFEEAGK